MYTIAMDMDGVLYPFDEIFLQLYKNYGGEQNFVFDKWVDFSTLDEGIVSQVWRDPELFMSGAPIPGAVETMRALEDMPDVKVVITTSFGRVPDVVVAAKWAWVQKWLPWFQGWNFITIHHKWLIGTDMIVDDFHNNVEAWMNKHLTGQGVLVRRPWNEAEVSRLERRGAFITDNGVQDILPLVEERVSQQYAKGA